VHVRPTPPTSTSPGETTQPTLPQHPRSQQALPRSRSSAVAHRRQARSSSPLRGCGRSSWTPDRATAQTGSDEEKPQQQSPQPGGPKATGHRVRPPRLLTATTPMGATLSSPLTESNRRPSPYHGGVPRKAGRRSTAVLADPARGTIGSALEEPAPDTCRIREVVRSRPRSGRMWLPVYKTAALPAELLIERAQMPVSRLHGLPCRGAIPERQLTRHHCQPNIRSITSAPWVSAGRISWR